MKIEVLYPEIANLYGDLENIDYLKKSYPEIEIKRRAFVRQRKAGSCIHGNHDGKCTAFSH